MIRVMKSRVTVIISADGEWLAIPKIFPDAQYMDSPYGQYFSTMINDEPVTFLHGGWAKIPAAASTQYAIDKWNPELIINLGTCGGFKGSIKRDTIIMVEKAVVYDIINQMSPAETAIKKFTTKIDLDWVTEPPISVHRTTIVSGDRDLQPQDIPMLKEKYGASVGDWESGAIAWVCKQNKVKVLILRGVSDLVDSEGGEAYEGNKSVWYEAAERIIRHLVDSLPGWIQMI